MENEEREVLIWSAMLHDIGKFKQRATAHQQRTSHAYMGGEAIEEFAPARMQKRLKELVSLHHLPDKQSSLLKIIEISDHLSASERKEWAGGAKTAEEISLGKNQEASLLENPLSNLEFPENKDIRKTTYFPLVALKSENILKQPLEKGTIGDYKKLWEEFLKEASEIAKVEPTNRLSFSILYYLMEKYTWAVPSATIKAGSAPDISLFDHCKLSTALAVCFYDAGLARDTAKLDEIKKAIDEKNLNEKEEVLALVAGDLSGIQKFIFRTGQGTKGGLSAKRVRGRSFMLKLVTDAITKSIMEELSLPEPCLLFSAGGRFAILAPNVERTRTVVDEILKRSNIALVRKYGGALSANIAVVPLKVKEIIEFQNVMHNKVKTALELSKRRKPHFFFTDQKIRSEMEDEGVGKEKCPICSLPMIEEKEYPDKDGSVKMCANCFDETRLGENLSHIGKSKTKYWQVPANVGGDVIVPLPGLDFAVCFDYPKKDAKKTCVLVNDNPPLYELKVWEGADAVLFETAGTYWHRSLKYDEMAKRNSAGCLGWLKMDVDNLGAIFNAKHAASKTMSLSRFCFLSRVLEYFFKAGVNEIMKNCPKLREPDAGEFVGQVIYSGGDDVFIVGSWDQILPLAVKISSEFDKFAGHSGISVSAGISITPSKYPIGMAAEEAEENLRLAKSFGENGGGKHRKRAVALLGDVAQFGKKDESIACSVEYLLKKMEEMEKLLPKTAEDEEKNVSFFRKLLQIRMENEQQKAKKGTKNIFISHRHVPKIHYLLARQYKKEESEKREAMRELLLEEGFYQHLALVASMEILLLRKSRGD